MNGTTGLSERLQTVRQFVSTRPAFTEGGLRWLIFQRGEELAAAGAIVRLGTGKKRRVFVDGTAFDSFLRQENGRR